MTKFIFRNTTYKSKDIATTHYMDYFTRKWKDNTPLTSEDFDILKDLLKLRTDLNIDTSTIQDFRIITNSYNAFEIQYLQADDPEYKPFSIKRCIIGKGKTDMAKINKTLRESISNQIWNYRKDKPNPACQLCLSENCVEVDHMEPIFSTIVKRYIEGKDLDSIDVEGFKQYHKDNANFRFLCKQCNISEFSKRGRKKILTREEEISRRKQYERNLYLAKKSQKAQEPEIIIVD